MAGKRCSVLFAFLAIVVCTSVRAQDWCDSNLFCAAPTIGPTLPGPGNASFPPGAGQLPNVPVFTPPNVTPPDIQTRVDNALKAVVPTDSAKLPRPQGNAGMVRASRKGGVQDSQVRGSEPVLGDGEFVVDATDITLAGIGVPYQFSRYYRSGVSSLTPLGAGWTHNLLRRIVPREAGQGCAGAYGDVYYVSETLERIRFWYDGDENGVARYTAGPDVSLRLRYRPAKADPWLLDDASGLHYVFDRDHGDLVAVVDDVGHSLRITWDQTSWADEGGKIVSVTDTTGRVIHYNYAPVTFAHDGKTESVDVLSCISLTVDCSKPLVSFETRPAADGKSHPGTVDFDLVTVRDANGDPTTYSYYAGPTPDVDYIPDAQLEPFCRAFCGTTVEDCHNYDVCSRSLDAEIASACVPVGMGFGDSSARCFAYCVQECETADPHCFADAANYYACTLVEMQSYCSHSEHKNSPECQAHPEVFLNRADICRQEQDECVALFRAEANRNNVLRLCPTQCTADCLDQKGAHDDSGKRRRAYGRPQDLRHNLIAVTDGDGRRVVVNRYGEDPFAPDFDKVVSHAQDLPPVSKIGAIAAQIITDVMPMSQSPVSTLLQKAQMQVGFGMGIDRTAIVGVAPVPDHEMTFEYHDLVAEQNGEGIPDPAHVTPLAAWNTAQICPHHCNRYERQYGIESGQPIDICVDQSDDYDPPAISMGPSPLQQPTYAVVVGDIDGTGSTNYYDSDWRLVREVHNPSQRQLDYNYQDGALIAMSTLDGDRTCFETDAFHQPVKITHFPAAGHPGQQTPQVTSLSYDDSERLIEVTMDPDGSAPVGKHFMRDSLERLIAVGEQVNAQRTNWTCLAYADPGIPQSALTARKNLETERTYALSPKERRKSMSSPRKRIAPGAAAKPHRGSSPEANVAKKFPGRGVMFGRSGCARNLVDQQPVSAGLRHRDIFPSTVTLPDGSVIAASDIGPSGPGVLTVDSNGTDPVALYFYYDDFGRPRETGRYANQTPKKGSSHHTIFDEAGLLRTAGGQDPNTGDWVDETYGYDHSHHVTSLATPEFNRAQKVDALGNLRRAIDTPKANDPHQTLPRTSCYQYDIHGRLLAELHPEGNVDQFTYGDDGRLTEIWRGYPSVRPGTWASGCNVVLRNNAMEKVAAYTYGKDGRPLEVFKNGVTAKLVNDGFGRVLDVITPHHVAYYLQAQPNGQLLNSPYTVSYHWVRGYDSFGRVTWEGLFDAPPPKYEKPSSLQSGMHALTEYRYDRLGRTTEIDRWQFREQPLQAATDGLLAKTTFSYDDANATINIVDARGHHSNWRRDGVGRLTHRATAAGAPEQIEETYTWNDGGDTVSVTTSPAPAAGGKLTVDYQYNPAGELLTASSSGKGLVTNVYDSFGRILSSAQPGLGTQAYEYDAYGRPVIVSIATAGNTTARTRLQRDGNDRLSVITDAEAHPTVYHFDGLDRVSSVVNGLGTTSYSYVPGSSHPSSITDPANTVQTLSYDPGGRLFVVTIDDGAGLAQRGPRVTRTFTYSPLGLLESASTDQGRKNTLHMAYDSIGRKILEENDALPLSIRHDYLAGSVTTSLVKQGNEIASMSESLDALERPVTLSLANVKLATFGYANGALSSISNANHTVTAMQYDDRGRLTGIDVTKGGQTPIVSLHEGLGADSVPRQRRQTIGAGQPSFRLFRIDDALRVIGENGPLTGLTLATGDLTNANDVDPHWNLNAPWATYTLDGVANWKSRDGSGSFTPAIDAANRYTSLGNVSLTYDGAGNLVNDGSATYTFDGSAELLSATKGNAHRAWEYDALGRVRSEFDGNSSRAIVWDGGRIVAMNVASDGSDGRLALSATDGHLIALADQLGQGDVHYLHQGPDSSVLAATDTNGTLTEAYSYSAYGEMTTVDAAGNAIAASTIGNRFLFQGRVLEPAIGLYFMGARAYRPEWGRFISPDPIGAQGSINLYAFAGGRPLNFTDPLGLSEKQNTHYPEPIASYMFQWQWDEYWAWRRAGLGPNGEMPDPQTPPDLYVDPIIGVPQESSLISQMYARELSSHEGPLSGSGAAIRDSAFEQQAVRNKPGDVVWGISGRIVIEAAPMVFGSIAFEPIAAGSRVAASGVAEAGEEAPLLIKGARAAINPNLAVNPEGATLATRLSQTADRIHSALGTGARFNMSTTSVMQTENGLFAFNSSRYLSSAEELALTNAAEREGAQFIAGTRISSTLTNHAEMAGLELHLGNESMTGALRGFGASRPLCLGICQPTLVDFGLIPIK